MSKFKEKSTQNLASAELLLKNYYYSSSVHCSFYSCLQNILHILFVKLNYDPVQFQNNLKHNNTGTHGWAAKLIGIEMAKIDVQEYKKFQKDFPEFKKIREHADYSNEMISQGEGYDALHRSNNLNNLLQRVFK